MIYDVALRHEFRALISIPGRIYFQEQYHKQTRFWTHRVNSLACVRVCVCVRVRACVAGPIIDLPHVTQYMGKHIHQYAKYTKNIKKCAVLSQCDTLLLRTSLMSDLQHSLFLACDYKQGQHPNQGILQIGVVIHDDGHLPHVR